MGKRIAVLLIAVVTVIGGTLVSTTCKKNPLLKEIEEIREGVGRWDEGTWDEAKFGE